MVNVTMACMALAASIVFYSVLDGVMRERHTVKVVYVYVPMWHCDGWAGPIYPTEKSMRSAFK